MAKLKAKKLSKPSNRVTLASLKAQIAELKQAARTYVDSVVRRSENTPYFFTTAAVEGKLPVVGVNELYAHVETAEKLGYTTELRVSGDRKQLRVVFVSRIPAAPVSLLY